MLDQMEIFSPVRLPLLPLSHPVSIDMLLLRPFHLSTDQMHPAVIEGYSEEFENTFMEHLRRSHPFSRVMAKNVYNEYIADK